MSLYSTETQPNAMGGKAENGPETISDPEVKKYTGNTASHHRAPGIEELVGTCLDYLQTGRSR